MSGAITVTGIAEGREGVVNRATEIKYRDFTVLFDGVVSTPVVVGDEYFYSYSLSALIGVRGPLTITVRATETETKLSRGPNGETVETVTTRAVSTSVAVQVDPIAPTVAIIAPATPLAGQPATIIDVPEAGLALLVTVEARDNFGVDKVEASLDNHLGYQRLERDGSDPSLWNTDTDPDSSHRINLTGSPLPTGVRKLFVRAYDKVGFTETSLEFTERDNTAPAPVILGPTSGKKIPWSAPKTAIEVDGTATDMQSGVKSVTCKLLDKVGNQVGSHQEQAFPQGSPGAVSWRATFDAPSAGWYSIKCDFLDHAGKLSTRTINDLEVAESFSPADINDLLGSRQYLEDLLKFFKDHFKRAEGAELKDITDITASDLKRVFHQEFEQLAKQTDAATAQRPVNQVRLCIEVLRKFLNDNSRSDTVWTEDTLPEKAAAFGDEPWTWITQGPSPISGIRAHQSAIKSGVLHQHGFAGATATLPVAKGERLFAYVYLDPGNLPEQVMLQWIDGTREHRAYWGEDKINLGTINTDSRRYMGPLPAAGRWVRLEVPASVVGLESKTLNGMAFILFGGRATWDRAGKTSRQPQLVGHWALDEGTGTAAADLTESGNNGVLTAGAAWAIGQGRQVLSLDGVDDYVQVGAPSQLAMNAVTSISAWICPKGPGSHPSAGGIIVAKESEYEIARFVDGSIQWAFANANPGWIWVNTGFVAPQDQWTHIVVTYDNGQVTTYANGIRIHAYQGTGLIGDVLPLQNDLRIGGRQGINQLFHGLISDVRIYQGALSATEVYALNAVNRLEREYALFAYEMLLRQMGTSYEELRLARGAEPDKRLALAERLGINLNPQWSTYLDLLLLEPEEITEAKLETLFGLVSTTQDPFENRSSRQLFDWQAFQLHAMWVGQDLALVEPIIDPDVIGKNDLANAKPTDPAYDLWKARSNQTNQQYQAFKTNRRNQPTALAGFQKIVDDALLGIINDPATPTALVPCSDGLGKPLPPLAFLSCLELQQKNGKDIQLVLAALHLDLPALRYLLRIHGLAKSLNGTVTDAEWEGVYHILTQVWKGSQRKSWRAAEAGLAIGPQFFKLYRGEPPHLPCTGAVDGVLLSNGVDDPSWILTTAPGATPTGKVYVTQQQPSVWVPNNDRSHWISPSKNASGGNAPGNYVYRAKFDLSGWDLATVQIVATVAVDDALSDVKLNGISLGLTAAGYGAFTTISLSGALQDGDNTVEFVVNNGGSAANPTGLRVELSFAAPPRRAQLPRWRVPEGARREWQAALRARIDQEDGLRQAFDMAIQATEEVALPVLRDALIKIIGAAEGMSPNGAADWLSERLLIGTQGGGWRLTSRVLQATETLQSLIFSLRTQRLADNHPADSWARPKASIPPDTKFDTQDQFDEEWRWAGSYETWRAAMLVFYYPENILLPSLREPEDRTLHFKTLIDSLRAKSRLTPKGARDVAKIYLDAVRSSLTQPLPDTNGKPFTLTDERTDTELARLRVIADTVFPSFTHNSPATLREIFYFVPMALALQLQKSGEYAAALDWFQTVYAYNLPLAQRKIYPGLSAEKNGTPILSRTEHWLREFLNPHQLAVARASLAVARASQSNPYTRYTLMSLARCFLEFADAEFTNDTGESLARARSLYLSARGVLAEPDFDQMQPSDEQETLLPNPVLGALRRRIENQLAKLHQGRNIAGMKRELEIPTPPKTIVGLPTVGSGGQLVIPGSRPRQKPTPYRFSVLMERSKQLVGIAQQIEAAYLATLEKRDSENYNLKRAGFDLQLAEAGNKLQDFREKEATEGEALVTKQKTRATKQKETYRKWIDDGLSATESAIIAAYITSASAQAASAWLSAGLAVAQVQAAAASATTPLAVAAATVAVTITGALSYLKAGADSIAIGAQTAAQVLSITASHERRVNDWQLGYDLADIDEQISDQQETIAKDHTAIVRQEIIIAQTQTTEARAMADYLANKFTSAELYEWMSGVLGGVYSYFLQQATGVAMLAESQLTFERQEAPTSFIQNDYWEAPSDGATANAGDKATDRRGLTGSARLLQDIYQLDQFAFETNKRKLNLSHTLSLGALDPYAFAVFRDTGVLSFNTPMRLFDEAFPGHYLRLIKRVRTSVVALIPPVLGIRATLMASGISRVMMGGDVFQEATIRRDPELVALSSPVNATGVFELDAQSELLMPFESMGVSTGWEFVMPRASNPFDFGTIADVMVTIEYTALFSDDYRRQVIQELDPLVSADRAYSIRNDFPDVWYDLNNGEGNASPAKISFRSERTHFSPNLDEDIKIRELLFAVLPKDANTEINGNVAMSYTPDFPVGSQAVVGDAALTDRRIHTRLSAGRTAWGGVQGKRATGKWEFSLPSELLTQLRNGAIDDLLVVTTFSGTKPSWPM